MRTACLLLLPSLLAVYAGAALSAPLAFTHVNVIDATGAPPQPDMTVVVESNRIAALGPGAQTTVPSDAYVVDAAGEYLIPGLWDMHVHTLRPGRPDTWFPLFVANGITGVRDMGGDMSFAEIRQLHREIADGSRIGPRFVAPGPILDGPAPELPDISLAIADSDAAAEAVIRLKREGADFIKVYNGLPRGAYFTIAAETQRLGMPFAGHVPFSITAQEASDAGQRSIEHLFNLLFACSSREDELMRLKEVARKTQDRNERSRLRRAYLTGVLDSYSQSKAQALFALFVKNDTWQVPTLVARRAFSFDSTETSRDNEPLQYLPPSERNWNLRTDPRYSEMTAEDIEIQRRFYRQDKALIAPMLLAGVKFLAGTDVPNPHLVPGFSLHDELALLVSAGLTPMQALQSATINPARYLG
ncbi:MAG: amidohydrolase family protein, partial [Stenotrophobium sp.]